MLMKEIVASRKCLVSCSQTGLKSRRSSSCSRKEKIDKDAFIVHFLHLLRIFSLLAWSVQWVCNLFVTSSYWTTLYNHVYWDTLYNHVYWDTLYNHVYWDTLYNHIYRDTLYNHVYWDTLYNHIYRDTLYNHVYWDTLHDKVIISERS